MALNRMPRAQIAQRAAQDLQPGWYVNLGVGIPTLIADVLTPGSNISLQGENGVLGLGPMPTDGEEHPDLRDAGQRPATLLPGGAFFDSTTSFAMIRGGHIDAAVLGAFQVSATGDLANWAVSTTAVSRVGGAADIAACVRHLYITMNHTERDGTPKIVPECTLPLTAKGTVERIYTDLAVIEVTGEGLRLLEVVDGATAEEVQSVTGAPLHWDDVGVITVPNR